MNCEVCGNESKEYALLPIRQPDGKLNTIACLDCSIESGVYCTRHNSPHVGFYDETTACRRCIDDLTRDYGEKIAGTFAAKVFESELRDQIQDDINAWLEFLEGPAIMGIDLTDLRLAIQIIETPHALHVSRAIFTYAQRLKITPEEVIDKVAAEGAQIILPIDIRPQT